MGLLLAEDSSLEIEAKNSLLRQLLGISPTHPEPGAQKCSALPLGARARAQRALGSRACSLSRTHVDSLAVSPLSTGLSLSDAAGPIAWNFCCRAWGDSV